MSKKMRFASSCAILHFAFTSLFAVSSLAAADDVPVEIGVWSNPEIEQHFVVLEEHHDGPCGVIAKIQVTQLPEPLAAIKLGFDLVVEYRQNVIVSRWATPANLVVGAIEGDSIYVVDWNRSFKIGTDGSIEVTKKVVSEGNGLRTVPRA
ncbi:MAG: hypothetical protein O7I42_13245 [Alphaproteobacteria bacterium]|nr:hypothetical protein [Alphaproteobacteria bacterium]